LNSDLLRVIPMHTLHGFAGEFRFEPVHRFDRLFVNPRRRWTISLQRQQTTLSCYGVHDGSQFLKPGI
jgi:hypothetical protein